VPTPVQQASLTIQGSTGTLQVSATQGLSAFAAGDAGAFWCTWANGGVTGTASTVTITDSGSHTWTAVSSTLIDDVTHNNTTSQLYKCANAGGATWVQWNSSTNRTYVSGIVVELPGSMAVDATGVSGATGQPMQPAGTTNAAKANSVTPTASGFVLAFALDGGLNSGTQPAAGTGFTAFATANTTFGGTINQMRAEWAATTAGVAIQAKFTPDAGSSYDWYHVMAVAFDTSAVGAALAGTPADTSSATGLLNPDFKGTPLDVSSGTGVLTTGIKLGGGAVSVSAATGKLPSDLAAALTSISTGSGVLTTASVLAGAASSTSNAAAALTNWASVTLVAPLWTGLGGLLDPNFWLDSVPVAGSVVYYDGTYITIQSDGEIVSTNNNCTAVVQFFDGTSWALGTVVITSGLLSYANTVSLAAGILTTAIQLAGAASDLVSASGALTTGVNLGGAATDVSSATGALTTQINLLGSMISSSLASGSLTGGSQLQGAAIETTIATGALTTSINLVQAMTSVVTATGNLSTVIQLAAAANSSTTASGSLFGLPAQLAGNVVDNSSASGALSTQISLAGPAMSLVTVIGQLNTQIPLLGAALSSAQASGTLLTSGPIGGQASDTSSATGSLTTLIQLSGAAFAAQIATGSLATQIQLVGAAQDGSAAVGNLTATGSPIGLYPIDPWFVIAHARQRFTSLFPQMAPGGIAVLAWSFTDDLLAGEQLQGTIKVNIVCSAGADPTPTTIVAGPAAYDPTQSVVEQPVAPLIAGNDYYFTVTAPTTNPFKTITRFGLLQVRS